MYDECGKCPFSGRKKCPVAVLDYDDPDVQPIVDALQKWSDEHPVKTRLDDLLEKYPKFKLFSETGRPIYKPCAFGYCDDCFVCPNNKAEHCWHEPVDGGATGEAVE
jgi:hypothetical protein